MYDDLIHELFPHRDAHGRPSYRRHQFETIRDTLVAFDDDSVTDIVVEAPTGAGKTSIAVTVARVMTRDFDRVRREALGFEDEIAAHMHMAEHQAHLVTSMKMLQNAYLRDDQGIKLVKGKGNYECHRSSKQTAIKHLEAAIKRKSVVFSCDEAEQIFGRTCDNKCPYKEARHAAQWAAIALHNFDSFLYQATMGQAFVPRRLLTVDEAHNCEEKLRGFMTMTFGPQLFESLDLDWAAPTNLDDMDVVAAWAHDRFTQVAHRLQAMDERLKALRIGRQGPDEILHAAKLARESRRLSMLQDRLSRFCRSVEVPKPARWVAYEHQGDVTLEPVDAGRFVPNALMKFGRQRLHLSATFLNGSGSYTRSINLRGHQMIAVPSTFDAERRRIVVKSAGDLGQKNWAKNFKNVVARLTEILDENPGVRGVVHCTSYDMAEQIRASVSNRRLLFYDRMTRESVIANFLAQFEDGDAVLVAVAMNEGYDFKDDLCRFQVIIRVPYIVPTKCVTARGEKDPRFYNWRTALALVQVYGRGMRSAEDWCRTYVLDDRFNKFVQRERDQLPGWFLEAMS